MVSQIDQFGLLAAVFTIRPPPDRDYSDWAWLLMIGIPWLTWAVLMWPWRPQSRLAFAARCSLWPMVILSVLWCGAAYRAICRLLGLDFVPPIKEGWNDVGSTLSRWGFW